MTNLRIAYIYIAVLFSAIFFSGCMTKQDYVLASGPKADVNTTALERKTDLYKIRKGDKLAFVVAKNPDASTRYLSVAPVNDPGYLVNSEGTISVPFVGFVKVEGLTIYEATTVIEEALKDYIKNPKINLELVNPKIFIIGEVNKPGAITVDKYTLNILEAIAYAGDFSDYADRSSIKIIRGNPKNPEVYEVDMTKMSSIQKGTIILPHDIVYVEPNGLKIVNWNLSQILFALTGSAYHLDSIAVRKTRF